MRIVKVKNKKVGDKQYYKNILSSIPEDIVKKSGLAGKSLKAEAEKGKIIVEKK